MKNFIFLLSTVLFIGYGANAQQQTCGTDEMLKRFKEQYPEIEKFEQTLNEQIKNQLPSYTGGGQWKTTAFDSSDTLHIPVVFHIVHDYGTVNYVPDNKIYNLLDYINRVYSAKNTTDLGAVIPTYQPYIGNAKIQFHMATKDPVGNPTTGITRRWSYLTYGGDNQAKFDLWAPDSYINIWIIDFIGSSTPPNRTLAYATPPASAAAAPWYDGIIGEADASTTLGINNEYTIPHEIGHVLNLAHTWGSTNNPGVACGDDDVDDTPPTMGEFGCRLYDTVCTNVLVPTSKIIIDSAARIADSIAGKGLTLNTKTGVYLTSVDIYPLRQGEGFNITLYDKNNNVIDSVARYEGIGDVNATNAAKADAFTGKASAGINFNVPNNARIESVTIYPTATGQPFTIMLTNGTDTVGKYTGTTTVSSGAQMVPVGFFVPKRNDYWMYLSQNPGLTHDLSTTLDFPDSAQNSKIKFTYYKDTNTGANKNYYNFLYNWNVRYRGVTDTPKNAGIDNKRMPYTVVMNWKLAPSDGYKLILTENQGLSHDTADVITYNKSIQCVADVTNERSDKSYNYLYNLVLRYGYIKGAGTACYDYPDTVNTQNIMNYSNCKLMFTKGQVERMRKTLSLSTGNRDKLITTGNHIKTGILNPTTGKYGERLDLKPVPDFSVERSGINNDRTYYMCADPTAKFRFLNRSWRDTITSVNWTFSNNPTPATSSSITSPVEVSFAQPGWVTINLSATGNNSGDSVISRELVYAADPNNKINPRGYFQEFNTGGDLDRWPIFNYYNNSFKWEINTNYGFFDKTSIMFRGFDDRQANAGVGSPKGDRDDFFTPPFDLSGIGSDASMNFMYAGAYRTQIPGLMRDTLQIAYSTDCGTNWIVLKEFRGVELSTKGTVTNPFAPGYHGDWAQKTIDLPAALRGDKVLFRFRFKPGISNDFLETGSGNNFYLDRINISEFPAGINTLLPDDKDVVVAPNPTSKGSYIIIRNTANADAVIRITDITGKVVYTTQQALRDKISRIEIPASAISVKGIYMVQVNAGTNTYTEKLVVY